MKTHFLGNEQWHEVPPDQVDDWDKFYRYVTAYLLKHGIQKASAMLQIDGDAWTVLMELKHLPPEQIN